MLCSFCHNALELSDDNNAGFSSTAGACIIPLQLPHLLRGKWQGLSGWSVVILQSKNLCIRLFLNCPWCCSSLASGWRGLTKSSRNLLAYLWIGYCLLALSFVRGGRKDSSGRLASVCAWELWNMGLYCQVTIHVPTYPTCDLSSKKDPLAKYLQDLISLLLFCLLEIGKVFKHLATHKACPASSSFKLENALFCLHVRQHSLLWRLASASVAVTSACIASWD